jgi:HK97 family phage major capsid protein
MPLSVEEERTMGLTTTAGGYAVPYTLDPTLILTSAGVLNPIRNLARVETITGNTWYGVSTTGISAGYAAEFTETSDNSPTLVQPSANVEKAQAFIPFSIEIGEDWQSFTSEMSRLFADAKDTLENTKFLTGLGHASSEPQGLIAVGGATAVISTATTATLAVADIYALEAALQPRSRARASIVGNKAVFQKVRQFDTAGGASMWTQLQFGYPADLIGYPVYEWSAYSSATTTSGSTVATIGDFSRFLIIDRVGMNVELIPTLFATANNRPYGARGLYCYWRNTSAVLTPGLLANSAFVSLKVL